MTFLKANNKCIVFKYSIHILGQNSSQLYSCIRLVLHNIFVLTSTHFRYLFVHQNTGCVTWTCTHVYPCSNLCKHSDKLNRGVGSELYFNMVVMVIAACVFTAHCPPCPPLSSVKPRKMKHCSMKETWGQMIIAPLLRWVHSAFC